jgi:serine/threonine-protein kinase
MIAGLSSVVAVILVALLWRATLPADRPMIRLSVDLGPEAIRGRAETGEFYNPEISPDGTRLVFPAKVADGSQQLAMRRLDQSTVTILPGTEGAVDPFFSPDGQWIGFFAGKKLKKIPLQGGAVVSLCDTGDLVRGASWGEDGAIIANLDVYHLFRIPAAGGEPQVIGKPEQHGERNWRWPQVLPGGENVLFTGTVATSGAALDSAVGGGRPLRSRPPTPHGIQADLRCRSEPETGLDAGRTANCLLFGCSREGRGIWHLVDPQRWFQPE